MTARLRIYAVYSHLAQLTPTGGDRINELATLRWMSMIADVYYNGVRFDPADETAGDPALEVALPEEHWDLVYIRSNKELLLEARGRNLKTLFLAMYDGDVRSLMKRDADLYEATTHVAVMTRAMEALYKAIASEMGFEITTVLLEQQGRADFSPRPNDPVTRQLRRQWGDGFIIGFFGRIDQASMPKTFMSIRHLVRHYVPDVRIVFGGRIARNFALPADVLVHNGYISGDQMPCALSACDMTVGVEQPEADWAGSNRALDCVRTETPLITRPYAARREQLGDDYPFYFQSGPDLLELIVGWRSDASVRQGFADLNVPLLNHLSADKIAARNVERLAEVLSMEASPPAAG